MTVDNCVLSWKNKPTKSGWYWMKCQLSSKAPTIKKVDWFSPYFVIDTSPLQDWKNWQFYGPLPEP